MPSSTTTYSQPRSTNTSNPASRTQIPYRPLSNSSTAITPYTHHNYTQIASISSPTAYPTPQPSTSSTRPPVCIAINAPRNTTTRTRDPVDIVPYTTPLNLNRHSRLFDRQYDHDFQQYDVIFFYL